MIRSISPRWVSEKLCASAGMAAPKARKATATMLMRRPNIIVISLRTISCRLYGRFRRFCQFTAVSTPAAEVHEPALTFRSPFAVHLSHLGLQLVDFGR